MRAVHNALMMYFVCLALATSSRSSLAATFADPTQWNVGDLNSTCQQWSNGGSSAPISESPVMYSSNPALDSAPRLTWDGAFVASSGGLYSFSTNYSITAEIHSFSPPNAAGTYLVVQTAGTVNPDYDPQGNSTGGGVLRDSFRIYDATNTLVKTSAGDEIVRTFFNPTYPLFGGVGYEQLIWEIYVPNLVGDFRITAESMVHSSLQALRIDSWVAGSVSSTGDFDGDGDVDGADFIAWQVNFPIASGATVAQGDADGDHDVDGADFAVWQAEFSGQSGVGGISAVPEPTSCVLCAISGAACTLAWLTKRISHRNSIERMQVHDTN